MLHPGRPDRPWVLFVLPLIPPFNHEYLIRWLISAAFIAALAVGFDFTAGFINIVNFGYAAIMGLGATPRPSWPSAWG